MDTRHPDGRAPQEPAAAQWLLVAARHWSAHALTAEDFAAALAHRRSEDAEDRDSRPLLEAALLPW
jgi:hypothetical protein